MAAHKKRGADAPTAARKKPATTTSASEPASAGDTSGPAIDIDAIVAAAVALTARAGLGALTMRAVAAEVGCATMALYRHVRDRDELVARVVDAVCVIDDLPPFPLATSPVTAAADDADRHAATARVMSCAVDGNRPDVAVPDTDRADHGDRDATNPDPSRIIDDEHRAATPVADDVDRRDATARAVASWLGDATAAMRRRLLAHPGTADQLLLRGPVGPHGMAFMNEVCGAIAALGLSPRQVAVGYDLLMSTVAAAVIKQLQLEELGAAGPVAGNDFGRRAAEYAAKLPHLRRVMGEFITESDDAFARRIGGLIDALVTPGNPLLARHR